MGGHAGGRDASTAAIAALFDTFPAPGDTATASGRDLLREAIVRANAKVWALAPPDAGGGRPGSTIVALLVHDDGAELAHVGDSRAYLMHAGQVFQLTRDHSVVQRMVDAQLLSPAQAAAHPDANRITRALGSDAEVEVDLRPQPLRLSAGDVVVLCTDGLSDLVGPEDLLRAVATGAPAAQIAGQLVALANARGGHDNITAQVIRIREASRTAPTRVAATLVDAAGPPGVPSPTRATTEPALPAFAPTEPVTVPPPRPSAIVIAAVALAVIGLALAAAALWYAQRAPG